MSADVGGLLFAGVAVAAGGERVRDNVEQVPEQTVCIGAWSPCGVRVLPVRNPGQFWYNAGTRIERG